MMGGVFGLVVASVEIAMGVVCLVGLGKQAALNVLEALMLFSVVVILGWVVVKVLRNVPSGQEHWSEEVSISVHHLEVALTILVAAVGGSILLIAAFG